MSHPAGRSRAFRLIVLGAALVVHACGDSAPAPSAPSPVQATGTSAIAGTSTEAPVPNGAPVLVLKTTPTAIPGEPYPVIGGPAPLTVKFNLCESTDPEQNLEDPEAGDTLNHQFHFGDDGTEAFDEDGTFNPDFEHFCRTAHTYEEQGRFIATVTVTDKHLEDQGHGVSSQARVTQRVAIEVSGTAAPQAIFCSAGGPIPDPGSTSSAQNIASAQPLQGMAVRLSVTHTWIGDLILSLRHEDTGTNVTLVNRPGPAGLGCNDNNIAVLLTDGGGPSVDGACPNTNATPGLSGTFAPTSALAAFTGETLGGTWRLTVQDATAIDSGTLDQWCLIPTL